MITFYLGLGGGKRLLVRGMFHYLRGTIWYLLRAGIVALLLIIIVFGLTFSYYEFFLPFWMGSTPTCSLPTSDCLHFEHQGHVTLAEVWQFVLTRLDLIVAAIIGFMYALVVIIYDADRTPSIFMHGIPPGRNYLRSVVHHRKREWFAKAAIIGVIVFVIGAFLYVWPEWPRQYGPFTKLFLIATRASDGGATFFFGLVTIIGFYLTLRQLKDFQSSIRSFAELIDRIIEMANEATATDPIHIIAYTPALGYLALPQRYWQEYELAITEKTHDLRPSTKTKMICLNAHDLTLWHRSFKNRHNYTHLITEEMADNATHAAEKIIKEIAHRTLPEGSQDITTPSTKDGVDAAVYRTTMDKMPGFYVFFTSRRAILANPLFIPYLAPHPADGSPPQMVNMLGFETTDRGVIHDLRGFFRYCMHYCDAVADPIDSPSENTATHSLAAE